MTNSIWAQDAALPQFPRLKQDLRTDVLIVGGGLAGLLCAYLLSKEGVDYALVEADRICHGVSRNTTAKITSQHALIYDSLIRRLGLERARMYLAANEGALSRYRELCKTIDCDFEEQDAYVYSLDHPAQLETEASALARLGFAADVTRDVPLPFPVAGALRFSGQAQFHPLKFAAAIAQGLHIYERTPVLAYDGKTFVTKHGRIRAKKAIVATHFPIFNKHGGYFLKLYQDRSYVLALRDAPDVKGMYIDAKAGGLSLRNHGGCLLLGGGAHRTGKPSSAWGELHAFAQQHYPGAQEVCRWAAQDCMTLDGVPYIGRYARFAPDLFVATGFNKWGMTSSMAAAQLLCDLVQDRRNDYAALFSPDRSMLRPQLFANALHSAANLLTPTTPRCPHMGCALRWNPQEHSWDCPCHGSRFDESGALLDNPATGNLHIRKQGEQL